MLEGEFLATQFYAEVDGHPEDAGPQARARGARVLLARAAHPRRLPGRSVPGEDQGGGGVTIRRDPRRRRGRCGGDRQGPCPGLAGILREFLSGRKRSRACPSRSGDADVAGRLRAPDPEGQAAGGRGGGRGDRRFRARRAGAAEGAGSARHRGRDLRDLPARRGQAPGRRPQRSMAGVFDHLAAQGFRSAGLWVLTDNLPARRFYEALGGMPGLSNPSICAGRRSPRSPTGSSRSRHHVLAPADRKAVRDQVAT